MSSSSYTCTLCGGARFEEADALHDHLLGGAHLSAAEGACEYFCPFCGLGMTGTVQYVEHLKGKPHIKKVRQAASYTHISSIAEEENLLKSSFSTVAVSNDGAPALAAAIGARGTYRLFHFLSFIVRQIQIPPSFF